MKMQYFYVFSNNVGCLLKSKQLSCILKPPRFLQLNSKKPICYWTQQRRYYLPETRSKLNFKTTLYGIYHITDSLTSKAFFHTSTFLKTNETNQERNGNSNKDKGNAPNNNPSNLLLTSLGLLGITLLTLVATDRLNKPPATTQNNFSWKDFVDKILPTGMVRHISIVSDHQITVFLHRGCVIDGKMTPFFQINNLKNAWNIENLLREEERKLNIDPIEAIPVESSVLPSNIYENLLLFIFLAWGLAFVIGRMQGRMSEASELLKIFQPSVSFSSKRSNIKFKDVAGMKEAKQEVMEFVDFLKNPKQYEALGAKMPRGCLLTGPPGVGKTLLAKAVATEAEVPFIAKAGSDFVELIGGLGARRIRQLFEEARKASPCIIYIDELDALGASRAGSSGPRGGNSEKDHTLNQLLVEMDGMLSKQHQVIVLASTNRADILDKAILRPGRFDRVIPIDLPTREEREEILLYYLNKLKLDGSVEQLARKLAAPTPGMSGADLANVCNEAAIYAARENDPTVQEKHLDYAVERVIAGAPKSATSVSPAEREVVAVHESGHALIGWLLEHTDALAKVTIIPRTKAALGFARTVPSNRYLHSQEQLMDYMCMALGGRAAEQLVKGKVTQGAQDDLKKVTDMAYAQVKHFGFSPKVGLLSFKDDSYVRPYSDALSQTMDQEVMELVKTAYERATKVLSQNRHLLNILSQELLARESMNYDDVENLIGPPVYGEKNKITSVPFGPYASKMDKDVKPSEASK